MTATSPRAPAPPPAALALLCAAGLLAGLDFMIMNVALPAIQDDLGLATAELQWVVSAYALALGGFLLLGGRLADLLGPRRLFNLGFGLFAAASLAGGLIPDGVVLILARAAQGLGAALLIPAALSLIAFLFAEGGARNRAMGFFTAMQAVGATFGLIAGGLLVDGPGWQWVMLVNVPLGVAAVALAPRLLPERQAASSARGLDAGGAVLVTGSLVVLLYAIVGAEQQGWGSTRTLGLMLAALVGLAAFTWVERRVTHPLMPLEHLTHLDRAALILVAFLLTASAWSLFFILTLHMQQVLGWSAILTGLAYVPMGTAIFAVARFLSPPAIARFGPRATLGLALGLNAAGLVWLASQMLPQGHYVTNLLGPMVVLAMANGMGNASAIVAALQGVPAHQQGVASGLVSTALQIGGALGVAILVTVATTITGTQSGTGDLNDLNDGYQAAILTAAGLAALGSVLATGLTLRSRRRARPAKALEGAQ